MAEATTTSSPMNTFLPLVAKNPLPVGWWDITWAVGGLLMQGQVVGIGAAALDSKVRSTITCQKFEELCGDLWEKSFIPFKEVLKHSGLKVDEVELIGNATHVFISRSHYSHNGKSVFVSQQEWNTFFGSSRCSEAAPGNNSEGNKDYLPVDDGISNASNSNVEKQSSMDPDTKETEEADI
ncbi:hypothetical protein HHK36_000612 [Tetracentron sinense]|uniref:Uncharacterized protein n=1 Tax=Tetracentron sinense TaxID=13715 RepID=A0A834ZRW1_TETSI|nr:hypothetical protein HHK36_000612 [Tetracentron sinense]